MFGKTFGGDAFVDNFLYYMTSPNLGSESTGTPVVGLTEAVQDHATSRGRIKDAIRDI